jgi:group I intron endonuclease
MGVCVVKKVSGIYQIINIINGKVYTGSSSNIYQRWKGEGQHMYHKRYNRFNSHLINAWHKYGKENFLFKVIEECFDMSLLVVREQYWLDQVPEEKYIIKESVLQTRC